MGEKTKTTQDVAATRAAKDRRRTARATTSEQEPWVVWRLGTAYAIARTRGVAIDVFDYAGIMATRVDAVEEVAGNVEVTVAVGDVRECELRKDLDGPVFPFDATVVVTAPAANWVAAHAGRAAVYLGATPDEFLEADRAVR